jgi:hypothetical protein
MRILPVLGLLLACQDYDVRRMKDFDSFVQGQPESPMDVLWVIDSSATMSEEQELVAVQMGAFVDILVQAQVDVHIGIITADASDGGALVGPVLDLDTPDLAETLTAQAQVGISGDRYEKHLESMSLACSAEMRSGANAGMFRPQASLQVIVLTDEDDQSTGAVEGYVDTMLDWKDEQQVRISAIAGSLPDGCHSQLAEAEAAPRLIDAVSYSGGEFESICEDDFGPVLRSMALGATGMSNHFELSDFPDLETLVVWVDEVRVHQRPHDGWQYSPGDNSIVFDGLAIPRPGQKVKVEYYDLLGLEPTEVEDSASTQ